MGPALERNAMKASPRAARLVLWPALALLALAFLPAPAMAQGPPPPPPGIPNFPSCGWNTAQNATTVASSPPGSAVTLTISKPSWEQECRSFGQGSESFVGYEVFPITIDAAPGTVVQLQAGEAIPTPEQVAVDGVRNTTIWTWFDPATVTTDSGGVATSNFTLSGAVMPFVANDISNVTLPIEATAAGATVSAGLPIEFEGGITVLQSPGPIPFPAGVGGGANNGAQTQMSVVYSPPSSAQAPSPLQINMQVVGLYENGAVEPLPSDVQVSLNQSTIDLQPYSVAWLSIDETNTLQPSNATTPQSVNYVFAVKETLGSSTYMEPLNVTVSLDTLIVAGGFPAAAGTTTTQSTSSTSADTVVPGTTVSNSSPTAGYVLALAAIAAVLIVAVVVVLRRGKAGLEGVPSPSV
jgi:hypothetical protein